ncbi:MAG: ATP-binding protein [Azonexus sp.]|jgi:two-component system sensor histidine kinase PilS (NtrC family)|nr:ATP-binding protein [Azonexus sp.]
MSPEPAAYQNQSIAVVSQQNDSLWRSLRYFSYYRAIVAGVFLATILLSDGALAVGSQDPRLFFWTSLGYLAASFGYLILLKRWPHAFHLQLTLQVVTDILLLTLMLFASGGAKSGIAMMMLVVLAGAGLVGQGRMVLFYAALATLALLLEQSYRVLEYQGAVEDYFRTGLTSIGFFGSAIAARLLARKVVTNEELARKRGVELADQMRINERVIRDMQDGVLVIDAAGRLRQYNPQASILLGLAADPPSMLAASQPVLAREFLTRRERGVESEMVMQVPQTGRTLRTRFLPPGEGGNTLIFLEDVSRIQQQAQQVKLAALGRLTANMAHEIRNPLAAISHAAELLGDDTPGAGAERLIRIIGDNTRRLNRLVSEVTELGRRDRASPERIDVREFIRQLLDELSLQDASSGTRIRLELPDAFTICFDRGHLHRVVSNLLNNALRYASQGAGAVRIVGESGRLSGRIGLHFIDDGPGIDAAECTEVFEPFFTTRASGTGLGLYIARELSEANGARLVLLDNAPGAHFCISCAATCQDQSKDLPAT